MNSGGAVQKPEGFLRLSDKEILHQAGKTTAEEAKESAEREFARYEEKRKKLEDSGADDVLTREVKQIQQKAMQPIKPKKREKG